MNKKIIHTVFENSVLQFPDRIAIEETGQSISYCKLNRLANGIAHAIQAQGIPHHSIVGLIFESSIAYVASILGVLKAGHAFMPLDVDFPPHRWQHLLEQTQPKLLIVSQALQTKLQTQQEQLQLGQQEPGILVLDDAQQAQVVHRQNSVWTTKVVGVLDRDDNPSLQVDENDDCYLIFTSGSTGEPKTILGIQKGLSHFIHWEQQEFGVNEHCKVSFLAPNTFDVSFRDIFLPLISGGTLCIPRPGIKSNIAELVRWIADSRLTLMHCVPSLFRLMMAEITTLSETRQIFPALQHVLLAGEAVYGKDVQQWMDLVEERIQLVNLYGPSETTLAKIFNRLQKRPSDPHQIMPLGQPISNTAILILKDNQLCPVGKIGEIYIKTPFRSKGYYRHPELTAQSFVQNPLQSEKEDILYKTGDLGRYLPDRSIEFIGRLDRQIKIHGIRVELSEVEHSVLSFEPVEQTLVVAHQNTTREYSMICYYTEKQAFEVNALREHLQRKLPGYMIPSFFLRLDAFPLNLNGKIDKKALPKPEEMIYLNRPFQAPKEGLETQLAGVFGEILGLSRVSAISPFYEIGGDSLKAIKIVARIYKILRFEISLKDFFEADTVEKLAQRLSHQENQKYEMIPPVEPQDDYPLSSAQQRLWVLDQLEDHPTAYNIPISLLIEGELDVEALEQALGEVIKRHESLQTAFFTRNGVPRQKIVPSSDFKMAFHNCSHEPDPESVARHVLSEDMARPFLLDQPPLLRTHLLKLSETRFVFLFNIHHIICDGWSVGIALRECFTFYHALKRGHALEVAGLPELRIQYKDYAVWQKNRLQSETQAKSHAYWLTQLSGDLPVLNLPVDFPRPPVKTYDGATLFTIVDSTHLEALKRQAESEQASLFMVLMTLIKILLYRYTEQEDLIVGTPIAGRDHVDLEHQVGCYVNTLALRDKLSPEMSFMQCLQQVKATTIAAFDHADTPFDSLLNDLKLERDPSRSPLFDVLMIVQNDAPPELVLDQAQVSFFDRESGVSKFDLSFEFAEIEEGLEMELKYNTRLFSPQRMEWVLAHFHQLIASVLSNPDQAMGQLNLLSPEEREYLLITANQTESSLPESKTILDLIDAQVLKTPEAVAYLFQSEQLSYQEVSGKANALAHDLVARGIGPGDLVPILMEKGLEFPVAALAVMKTGAAFAPLDVRWPEARLSQLLKQLNAKVCLIRPQGTPALSETGQHLLSVRLSALPLMPASPPRTITQDDLIYGFFTSGSTGLPKCALNLHRGILNRFLYMDRVYGTDPEQVILQTSQVVFDTSVWQFFWPLSFGGKCVLPEISEGMNLFQLAGLIAAHRITFADFVPSVFNLLVEQLEQNPDLVDQLASLQQLVIGGEAINPKAVQRFHQILPKVRFTNAYGPTETSIGCIFYHPDDLNRIPFPIGKPIDNVQVLLLDKYQQPVSFGIPGELYLAGSCLGAGYFDDEEKTRQAFVKNPFPEISGDRLYKTGDMAVYLPDGNLRFLSRIDQQLKISGVRVEPGEVEHALMQHEQVQNALVLIRSNELVGYVQCQEKLEAEELRTFLTQWLPQSFIPRAFVVLKDFPLTKAGKVDRKAMPEPDWGTESEESGDSTPLTEQEKILAQYWGKVLKKEKVGRHDNYFTLGGDSIKAIQLVSLLSQQQMKLEIRDLFRFPTIATVAPYLTILEGQAEQGLVQGQVPLTPIQKRMFTQKDTVWHHFNQSVLFSSRDRISKEHLEKSLRELHSHHDILRATFDKKSPFPEQVLAGEMHPIHLEIIDLQTEVDAETRKHQRIRELQESFDLKTGPLLKAVVFQLAENDELLLIIHHLVIDVVSWHILWEDLSGAYQQSLQQNTITLPSKTDSFLKWAEALATLANTSELQEEKAYWETIENTPVPRLPEGSGSQELEQPGRTVFRIEFSKVESDKLLSGANDAYHTNTEDLLVTALVRTLIGWHQGDCTLIAMESHGREVWETMETLDVSRTIGWFTSFYPVLFKVVLNEDLGQQIKQVKETLHQVPHKGMGYGLLRYAAAEGLRTFQREPQISFNFLGQIDSSSASEHFTIMADQLENEVHPQWESPQDLEFNAQVLDGCLQMEVTCPSGQYHAETLEQVTTQFRSELQQLVEHCLSVTLPERTPSDMTLSVLTLDELKNLGQVTGGQILDVYPLSPMQEGMLYHALLDHQSSAYFDQTCFAVVGPLDIDCFIQAWNALIDRHEILRTAFVYGQTSRPVQVVLKEKPLDFRLEDLRQLSVEEQQAVMERTIQEDRAHPFDLAKDSLMRMIILQRGDFDHYVIWSRPHVLMDGWCTGVLLEDFFQFYPALQNQTPLTLPPVGPYSEYIRWVEAQDHNVALRYWRDYLQGYAQLATLPKKTALPTKKAFEEGEVSLVLDKIRSEQLQQLCNEHQVTLNSLIQTVWGLVLAKNNNVSDVVFGTIVSGRPETFPHIERMVGLCINTVPVRVRLQDHATFSEKLREVQQEALDGRNFHYSSLAAIQAETPLKQSLFDHVLIFESYPIDEAFQEERIEKIPGLALEQINVFGRNNYDFFLRVMPQEPLRIELVYNRNVFDDSLMQRLRSELQRLFEALTDFNTSIGTLKQQLLQGQKAELKKKRLSNFKKVSPRQVRVNQSLVETEVWSEGLTRPWLVRAHDKNVILKDWVQENHTTIEQKLKEHGAVLFENFRGDSLEHFHEIASLFTEPLPYLDRSSPRHEVEQKIYISTEYPEDQTINMHNELSYSHNWPMRLLFFCQTEPTVGGETPIADSRQVYALLKPGTRDKFQEKGIRYIRNLVQGVGLSWQEVYQTQDRSEAEAHCQAHGITYEWRGDNLRTQWQSSAIQKHPETQEVVWFNHGFFFNALNLSTQLKNQFANPDDWPFNTLYGDGTPIEPEVVEEIGQAYKQAEMVLPWKHEDVRLLDNMLMAHARRPYQGDRRILVAMGNLHH